MSNIDDILFCPLFAGKGKLNAELRQAIEEKDGGSSLVDIPDERDIIRNAFDKTHRWVHEVSAGEDSASQPKKLTRRFCRGVGHLGIMMQTS